MRRFSKETIDGSSDSVIVKNDSVLEVGSAQLKEIEEIYDLEVQKPTERAKILNDSSFFTRLSFSFYSDFKKNCKSMPTLPKYIERSNSIEKDNPLTDRNGAASSPKTNCRSMQNLGSTKREQHNRIQEEPNQFKIKILQNFRIEMTSPKLKFANLQQNLKRIVEKQKATENNDRSIRSREHDRPSFILKQQKKPMSPVGQLEKIVKHAEKWPLSSAIKSSNRRTPPKNQPEQPILSERGSLRTTNSKQFIINSSRNSSKKHETPKTNKVVLVPSKCRLLDKDDQNYFVKAPSNTNPNTEGKTVGGIVQFGNFPRPSLKKFYI